MVDDDRGVVYDDGVVESGVVCVDGETNVVVSNDVTVMGSVVVGVVVVDHRVVMDVARVVVDDVESIEFLINLLVTSQLHGIGNLLESLLGDVEGLELSELEFHLGGDSHSFLFK